MRKLLPEFLAYGGLFIVYSVLAAVAVPNTVTFSDDLHYWIDWVTYMQQHGFSNAYDWADNNYNPLFQYVLWIYLQLVGGDGIADNLYVLKVLTMVFDFAAAILAGSLVPGRRQRFLFTMLLLLNVGYLYNSVVWGQVDSIYTCLVFAAMVLSLRERPVWGALFFVLALNAKLQALIFLPILLALWFPQWVRKPRVLPQSLLIGIGAQALLLLPFMATHPLSYLSCISYNTLGSINYYSVLSVYCYNLWHLIFWRLPDLYLVPDGGRFAGLTYHEWGLLLFMLASAVLLLPLLLVTLRNALARQRFQKVDYALLLLSAGLIPVLMSYFNTQMHSRYVHASVLLLGTYGVLSRRYVLFAVVSVAYLLNQMILVNILNAYDLRMSWNPQFNPRFIASLYTFVVLAGLREVYQQFGFRQYLNGLIHEWQQLRSGAQIVQHWQPVLDPIEAAPAPVLVPTLQAEPLQAEPIIE